MYTKIIKTKDIYEVYKYKTLNLLRLGCRSEDEEPNQERSDTTSEENYRRTQRRRRGEVRRLITQNFDTTGSKFVTLTFRDTENFDIRDVSRCYLEFKNFILRLNRHLAKKSPQIALKYVTVVEFQDKKGRGAVHFHMICNLPFIKKSTLANIWGLGFVKINAIDNVDNLGAYVTKYMNKDLDDNRLMGKKAYSYSANLEKPETFKSWERQDHFTIEMLLESLYKENPVFTRQYKYEENEILYTQYNLKRANLTMERDSKLLVQAP